MNELSTQLSPDSPNAQTNPQVQEALSKRYAICAIVTPLNNGQFSVFANDRSLDSLVICSPEDLPIVIASRAKMNPRKTNPPNQTSQTSAQLASVDLSDL